VIIPGLEHFTNHTLTIIIDHLELISSLFDQI